MLASWTISSRDDGVLLGMRLSDLVRRPFRFDAVNQEIGEYHHLVERRIVVRRPAADHGGESPMIPDRPHSGAPAQRELPGRRLVMKRLLAVLAVHASDVRAAQPKPARPAAEAEEIVRLEKAIAEAKLGPIRRAESGHFLARGNAPSSFQREALRQCEALGQAFLAHFRERGFNVDFPPRRLSLVILKDRDSYSSLLGKAPGKDVGGHYDLETNRLVVFDFWPQAGVEKKQAEKISLFTLVHETAHQLSFNTGLLDRGTPFPLCISEGLATYVELWRQGVKNAIGGRNGPRLLALRDAQDWIPIADLLADDKGFEPESEQLAYAESWLLVHHLLSKPARLPRFQAYLRQAKNVKTQAGWKGLAERTLGPLADLDRELKAEAKRLLREVRG
jgi:hypothetical protein